MTKWTKSLPKEVTIFEVGPRDGLQNEKIFVPTQNKIDVINGLSESGLKKIEVSAFVSPKWIPNLSDAQEVMMGIKKNPQVKYVGLIPNLKGYDRAIQSGVDEVSVVIAATQSHNQKNLNASTEVCLQRYQEVFEQAQKNKIPFRAYVSCAFGCPYEGNVSSQNVLELCQKLLDEGAYEISLGDTIGVASPTSTFELLEVLLKKIPQEKLALHMHDTRGCALANILVALQFGIATFDSSLGGLGGCPYAKGAAGNVASEDLINMLKGMSINTGISMEKIIECVKKINNVLNKNIPSKMYAVMRPREISCE